MLALALLLTSALMAQEAKVTPLMSKDLPESPGKEGLMIMVEYPPGASDPVIATMRTRSFMCWRAPS